MTANYVHMLLWIVLLIILLVLEFGTPLSVVAIWFFIPCIVCAILSYFGVSFFIQLIVFIGLSIVCMLFLRPLTKVLRSNQSDVIGDKLISVIGKETIIEKEIKGLELGTVVISGITWKCKSKDEKDIEKGTVVKVVDVKGNILIVEKMEEN